MAWWKAVKTPGTISVNQVPHCSSAPGTQGLEQGALASGRIPTDFLKVHYYGSRPRPGVNLQTHRTRKGGPMNSMADSLPILWPSCHPGLPSAGKSAWVAPAPSSQLPEVSSMHVSLGSWEGVLQFHDCLKSPHRNLWRGQLCLCPQWQI